MRQLLCRVLLVLMIPAYVVGALLAWFSWLLAGFWWGFSGAWDVWRKDWRAL